MADISEFTKGLSNEDKLKMLDSLIAKLIEDNNPDSIIRDTITCLLHYKPFIHEKGKSYDGLAIHARYGVRGY